MLGRYRLAIALSCLASVAGASLTPAPPSGASGSSGPRSFYEARVDPREPAQQAIRKHLAEMEHLLRAYPPSGLSAGQAAARADRIEDLRAYRLRGDFPRNLDFPDRLIPYFIDARGIACAVGQLVIASGDGALAFEIARNRNHAYIPEIDDPRLADWARRNGLTLEECARIQPSYAAHYSDIVAIGFDGGNRPWVVTGNGITVSGYILSHLGAQGWSTAARNYMVIYRDFCMVGDRPLLVHHNGFDWNGETTLQPGLDDGGGGTCAATPDGAGFWIGGKAGLRKYAVEGSGTPVLAETVRAGVDALPGDTVDRIAVAGDRVWVATTKGLAYRRAGGAWARLTFSDLAGGYPGGLEADGAQGAWIGLLHAKPAKMDDRLASRYSEFGLVRMDRNGQVTRYHRGNSPLPSDTILLAAPSPDGGVWLTSDGRKILHFLPPDRLTAVPEGLPRSINALEPDALGRLHAGTYGGGMAGNPSGGLFRVEGDSLAHLGYPTGAVSIARPKPAETPHPAGWGRLLGPGGNGYSRLDLLGRRVDPLR
jgi:hypothetical protein